MNLLGEKKYKEVRKINTLTEEALIYSLWRAVRGLKETA